MDFGLILGILVVVAIGVYIWLGRENNKLDGLDETFPSDCSVDTKPEVTSVNPVKAESVFSNAVIAPAVTREELESIEAVEPPAAEEVVTPPQKPKAKPKAKAKSEDAVTQEHLESLTKKQIDKLAADKGIKLDARKNKATMIKTFLDSL